METTDMTSGYMFFTDIVTTIFAICYSASKQRTLN